MKHLTIVVPEGQDNLSSIVGPYNLFSKANEFWRETGHGDLFAIQLAGSSREMNFNDGLFSIKPQVDISGIDRTDLIIIPSVDHTSAKAMKGNKLLMEWIVAQYKNGAAIASICTGAFLLASTGLLDGKYCATHWEAAEDFRRMFGKVKLQTDKLITDENGIYTNGGAYSFLNLMIYLIEKYYDRQTAIFCAKIFQIEIDRQSQSAFVIFNGQKMHGDEMVKEAQRYIECKPEEKISIAELSARFPVSRRQFDRRFIKATGNTPLEYVQRVKIEVAKKALETTRKTINEVMYEVGYSDEKAFREIFQKITGLSPLEYKGQYNKEMAYAPSITIRAMHPN